MIAWFTGTATPLILMLIGAPTDKKMSEAFLSAMTWNSRFIADIFPPCSSRPALVSAQQLVQAGLRPGLGIDLLDDDRTVQAVLAVGGGQSARNHHGTRRDAPIADFARGAVEDAGALAEEYAHRNDAVLLDDHALHDLRARADEAVVLDDHGVRLQRLEHSADAHAARQVHVPADLGAGADRGPGVHHGALVDVG